MPTEPAIQGYRWSPEVQRKGVALCLRDKTAYLQLGPRVFDAKYVTHPPLKAIAMEVFKACADGGGAPPSPEMVEELVKERAARLKPAMADAVRAELALVLSADLSDARLVRAKMAEWAREEAAIQAAEHAADLIARGAIHNGHGAEILKVFREALAVGKGAEATLRVIGDGAGLLEQLSIRLPRTTTGFPAVDRALGGGAEMGLHVIAGDPKLGKTSFLTQLAAGAARRGLTVWHISGEVTIRAMAFRYAAALTGISKADVRHDPKRAVEVIRAYRQTRGDIILEYVPKFTVSWMASRLRQLESQGRRIGVIVADYIDLMGAEKERGEKRHEQEDICNDLRALAVEVGVPVWTAKGVNRKAVGKAVVTKADLAECFAVAYVADTILALCATDVERRKGMIAVGGRQVPTPIIRLFYATGREDQDEYMIAAYERDNARQRWVEIPGYLEQFAAAQEAGRGQAE